MCIDLVLTHTYAEYKRSIIDHTGWGDKIHVKNKIKMAAVWKLNITSTIYFMCIYYRHIRPHLCVRYEVPVIKPVDRRTVHRQRQQWHQMTMTITTQDERFMIILCAKWAKNRRGTWFAWQLTVGVHRLLFTEFLFFGKFRKFLLLGAAYSTEIKDIQSNSVQWEVKLTRWYCHSPYHV